MLHDGGGVVLSYSKTTRRRFLIGQGFETLTGQVVLDYDIGRDCLHLLCSNLSILGNCQAL